MTAVRAEQLQWLADLLESALGLHFPRLRWGDLERNLGRLATAQGFDDVSSCLRWLESTPMEGGPLEALIDAFTIGETYFFRDAAMMEAMATDILPTLIASRRETTRKLTVWSAGCCTGEEPYTVAVMLDRLLPRRDGWEVNICGTDINPAFLARAREAVYRPWSFRGTPREVVDAHFERLPDGSLRLLPRIKEMVTFTRVNLADSRWPSRLTTPGEVDLLLCRNVLMYFSPPVLQRAVERFHRSLAEDGSLIVAPAEVSAPSFSPFGAVKVGQRFVYRKRAGGPAVSVDDRSRPLASAAAMGSRSSVASRRAAGAPTSGLGVSSIGPSSPRVQARPSVETGPRGPRPAALAVPPSAAAVTGADPLVAAQERFDAGQWAECVAALTGLVGRPQGDDPTEVRLRAEVLLARALANQGSLTQARRWCDSALDLAPLRADLRYLAAVIAIAEGRTESALERLSQATYLDAEFIMAHFMRGHLLAQQGDAAASRRHMAMARTLLSKLDPGAEVPAGDGMRVGHLADVLSRGDLDDDGGSDGSGR